MQMKIVVLEACHSHDMLIKNGKLDVAAGKVKHHRAEGVGGRILNFSGVGAEKALEGINDCDNIQILNHMGIKWADGTALLTADESLKQLAEKFGKPVLDPKEEAEWGTAYPEFYDLVWSQANENE